MIYNQCICWCVILSDVLSLHKIRLFLSYFFQSDLFLSTRCSYGGLFVAPDHTHTHTLGMTSLDEGSARRRDLYLTAHDTHNRQISMPLTGFEPAFSANEQPQFQHLSQRGHRDRREFYVYTSFIKIRDHSQNSVTSLKLEKLCVHKRIPRVPTQIYTVCTDVSCLIYMVNSDYFTHDVKRLVFVADWDQVL